MLDKVKGMEIETGKVYSGLLPLHKTLIQKFPSFKKELISTLRANGKLGLTQREINTSITEILQYTSNTSGITPHVVKYAWKVSEIIRQLARNNTLFYKDLPKGWEEYLRRSIDEVICSMKNKDFLLSIFENVIQEVKAGRKINFTEIHKSNPEKNNYKHEISKVHDLLKDKYNIEFISIGGSGNILKIGEFVEKNDVKDNLEEIEKCFERLIDHNAVGLNIVNQHAFQFIHDIVVHRSFNEFQQHEMVLYCLKKSPELNIDLVRTSVRKIFRDILEQGVIIRNKSKINYEVKFNKIANDFYHSKFFPDLTKNSELSEIFHKKLDDICSKTAKKNKDYVLALKNEILELNKNNYFFILSDFIEKYSFQQERTLYYNRILLKLIQSGILGRKGRERYYINNFNFKVTEDKTEVLKVSHSLGKYEILGHLNALSNKIIYYIFKDLKEVGLSLEDIKSNDLKICVENEQIFLIFLNDKFKNFEHHLTHICDDIGEKKGVVIHPIFKV